MLLMRGAAIPACTGRLQALRCVTLREVAGRGPGNSARPRKLTGFMMCMMTQRELNFLASLKTSWRLLYRRELMRLIRGDVEAGEPRPETRAIGWRVVSG